jgi:adenylate kinase family enzyme
MRVAITGASGNGKTTLAQVLSRRFDLPFLDLESAGPARATELLAGDEWVSDATHERVLGDLVLVRAQVLVWLDLPLLLILWRALRRDRRIAARTVWAHFSNRRAVPARAARYPHVRLVRLRSPREVERLLRAAQPAP